MLMTQMEAQKLIYGAGDYLDGRGYDLIGQYGLPIALAAMGDDEDALNEILNLYKSDMESYFLETEFFTEGSERAAREFIDSVPTF